MHSTTTPTARAEWRAFPMLPVAAGLGYATSVIHIYGIGPFYGPIAQEFGWSRTEVTFGLTIATLVQAIGGVFVGLAVDRFGPRRFALVGMLTLGIAFSLLGTATGTLSNWYWLWGLIAFATLPVQASVWTSAVASRFSAARGMAFAVTLCGASVAAGVFPPMATWLIGEMGWRLAFVLQASIWLVIALPAIFFFFHGRYDKGSKQKTEDVGARPTTLPGATLREGLFSSVYHRLFFASLLFTFTIIGLVVHFTAILGTSGATPMVAAGIASFIGGFSIAGRLGTGALLDRMSASTVGAAVFLLPVLGCLLLLFGGGSFFAMVCASALIGLTLGAEIDVVVYLLTRHFGLRNFGGLYGGLLAALSIGTAIGPLVGAQFFDRTGSYDGFLWLGVGLMALSSVAIATLPRGPAPYEAH